MYKIRLLLLFVLVVSGLLLGGYPPNSIPPPTGTPGPVILPEGVPSVRFTVPSSQVIDQKRKRISSDHLKMLVDMNADELASQDLVSYTKFFGPVGDAGTAAKICAIVHKETYGHIERADCPYEVVPVPFAGAWIAQETLPPGTVGGGIVVAILMKTGQVIMVSHGK